MDAMEYARSARRHWFLLLAIVVVAAGAAGALSAAQSPTYAAETRLVIGPNRLRDERDIPQTLDALTRRSIVTTFAEVVESGRTQRAAARRVGVSDAELEQYEVTATGLPEANVVKVKVVGPSGRRAQRLVVGVGNAAADYLEGLYQVYAIEAIDPPEVPESPVAPKPLRDAGVAGFVAAILALLGSVARDRARGLTRTDDAEHPGIPAPPPVTVMVSIPERVVAAIEPARGERVPTPPPVERPPRSAPEPPSANGPDPEIEAGPGEAEQAPSPLPLGHWLAALSTAAAAARAAERDDADGSAEVTVTDEHPRPDMSVTARLRSETGAARPLRTGGTVQTAPGVRRIRREQRVRGWIGEPRPLAPRRFNGGRRAAP